MAYKRMEKPKFYVNYFMSAFDDPSWIPAVYTKTEAIKWAKDHAPTKCDWFCVYENKGIIASFQRRGTRWFTEWSAPTRSRKKRM